MNKRHLYPRLLGLLLLLLIVAAARGQTYSLEYWFDKYSTNGVKSVSFSGSSLNKKVSVTSLKPGFHTIYMRVKASDGMYSPVTSSSFLKFTASSSGDSKVEYWFDNNVGNRATTDIDVTSEVLQVLDLDLTDMEKFPLGFHQLNMRVAAYGGLYSPVYSTYVMRLPMGQVTKLTYWLDDNYLSGRNTVDGYPVSTKTTVFDTQLDLSTAPVGMHRFKYRITHNGVDNGVVYEVPILITKKYNSMGEVTVVAESRWVDDASPAEYAISSPNSVIARAYTLNPAALSVGQHSYHLQYKNSADVWSETNVTYFYKDESGILRVGRKPDVINGINEASQPEQIICFCERGTIVVDCQSPRLASTGIVQVYDMTGKMVAQQTVNNSDGIHTEISVDGYAKQILIVRVMSGELLYNKKIMVH